MPALYEHKGTDCLYRLSWYDIVAIGSHYTLDIKGWIVIHFKKLPATDCYSRL
jgi:hypothetical protein